MQLELGVDESYTIFVAAPGGANSIVGGATIEVRIPLTLSNIVSVKIMQNQLLGSLLCDLLTNC